MRNKTSAAMRRTAKRSMVTSKPEVGWFKSAT